jgi:6-phosphogluconolactonase
LGSQESIVLSPNGDCLFAVNAGSDTVTSFEVNSNSLEASEPVLTNGEFPVSLAVSDELLYVLNAANGGSITGFNIGKDCELDFIPGSVKALNAARIPGFDFAGDNRPFFVVSPGQISFTPDGNSIIAAVKGTTEGILWVFPDASTGTLGVGEMTVSAGSTPFSFDFDSNGNLLVAEAFGEAPQPLNNVPDPGPTGMAGAVSSYSIASDGTLAINGDASVGSGETATCWVKYDGARSCAFTTSNGSGAISSYAVDGGGKLTLNLGAAALLDTPIDFSIVGDFLYVLSTNHLLGVTETTPEGDEDQGRPSIYVYEIEDNCSLKLQQVLFVGLPDEDTTIFGAVGMVATSD